MLTESSFKSSSYTFNFRVGIATGISWRSHDALVKLHDRLTRTLLGWQFKECIGNLVGDVLNHVDLVARPGSSIIALLQNHTTVSRIRAAQANPQQ